MPSISEYAREYFAIFFETVTYSCQTVDACFCDDAAGPLGSSKRLLIAVELFVVVVVLFPPLMPFLTDVLSEACDLGCDISVELSL